MRKTRLLTTAVGIAVGFIVLLLLTSGSFKTLDPGEKGVLFRRFGGGLQKDNIYGQGFHLVAPWNTMYRYDTRLKELYEEMDVLASNGLAIHVDLSVRYRVEPDKVGYLHENIGRKYIDIVITPEVRSSTRRAIGQYTPEELYSTKRDAIQTEIFDQLNESLQSKDIVLDAVLIREIGLPTKIEQAIERKLEEEQKAQQYTYRLQQAEQEKERLRIEAEGIEQYQNIVSRSLSDRLLKWQGIEATKKLAESPNSKTVVIGGSDGLPLILNQ